jgi:hypothetical protein
MSQGCTLVLLLAMMIALAVGLMAWGPISLQPADHQYADLRQWAGLLYAFNALSCLPLFAVCLWGLIVIWRSDWPSSVRAPWLGFFALAALHSVSSALYHLSPGDVGHVLSHAFVAGAFAMLLLGFLSERVDVLYGSTPALATGLALAAAAGLWWFAGDWATGHGDLRPLLFLESLPILLIPAGALALSGTFTSSGDWLAMLCLYVASRGAGLADSAVFDATGWVSGHTLMQLLQAGVAARLAYRAGMAPGSVFGLASAGVEPTQRNTSLNTSS